MTTIANTIQRRQREREQSMTSPCKNVFQEAGLSIWWRIIDEACVRRRKEECETHFTPDIALLDTFFKYLWKHLGNKKQSNKGAPSRLGSGEQNTINIPFCTYTKRPRICHKVSLRFRPFLIAIGNPVKYRYRSLRFQCLLFLGIRLHLRPPPYPLYCTRESPLAPIPSCIHIGYYSSGWETCVMRAILIAAVPPTIHVHTLEGSAKLGKQCCCTYIHAESNNSKNNWTHVHNQEILYFQ